jgi:hypothetical protein
MIYAGWHRLDTASGPLLQILTPSANLHPIQPGYFMNLRRQTMERAVPPGNRKGIGLEAYSNLIELTLN